MAVQKKAAPVAKKKKKAPVTHNSKLTFVLGILIMGIAGIVFYVLVPQQKPKSLIDISQSIHSARPSVAETDQEPEPSVTAAAPPKASVAKATNPAPPAATKTAPPAARAENNTAAGQVKDNSKKEFLYIIQPGETLFRVTQRFNMPREDFKKLNNLADDQLKAGQEVKVNITELHHVKAGETLTSISGKYTIDKVLIQKANNLQAESIAVGQQLVIPRP
jgi:LysM repeat protein